MSKFEIPPRQHPDCRIFSEFRLLHLCENYYLETEMKYWYIKLTSVAIMISLRYLPNPIIARKVSMSEFFHRLDPEPPFDPKA